MGFLSVAHSDIGIKKNINQDSVLIKEASTAHGDVLLTVICDGMGGLAKGEVASTALVKAFSSWFEEELPWLIYGEEKIEQDEFAALKRSWNQLIDKKNVDIKEYAEGFHATCGTTLVAMLLFNGRYLISNIGDSRVYQISDDKMQLLTKDQTYVQREMDEGRMKPEEAKDHPQRNVLLQCVGATDLIIPDFFEGTYQQGEVFMLCSDGFRHQVSEEEFFKMMAPEKLPDEKAMKDATIYFTELNKQRKERDNISVILIKME